LNVVDLIGVPLNRNCLTICGKRLYKDLNSVDSLSQDGVAVMLGTKHSIGHPRAALPNKQ